MITDIFLNRYPEIQINLPQAFFRQLFNLYDDHHLGIHGDLLNKIRNYPYSQYADEHIRIIEQSMKKLCNELGYENLDKAEYLQPDYGFNDYRIFKNYIFDRSIKCLEKISLLEILFRETERHFLSEIDFLRANIPQYKKSSNAIKSKGINVYNEGEIELRIASPQLASRENALQRMRDELNQRLKQHKIPFSYHNGHFQKSHDELIEDKIEKPFWELISDSKYKNVEIDMLEAIDKYDSGDRASAFYAAKALESMIKIICDDKGFTNGKENGAVAYLNHLNSQKNGSIIMNEEKDELLAMFRIRNSQGHGAGNQPMPELSNSQTLRYINSAMVWIKALSNR
jgi:hypothetical protein